LRRLLVAGLAGLAFVSAAACGAHVAPPAPGSAASPGAGPNATPGAAPGGVADQEAARQTVEAFFEGIITGNSKSVCGLMTAQAVADAAQAARSNGGSTCDDWVIETRDRYAGQGVMPPAQVGVGDVQISGDSASISGSDITIVPSSGPQSNPAAAVMLRRTGGRWQVDIP